MIARRPLVLVVCDGWGARDDDFGNAIRQARTPVFDGLCARWPHTLLEASGAAVGLPDGQMGNSEVGHLTIGSGRIVLQPLSRLNQAVADASIYSNEVLSGLVDRVKQRGNALHCLGMVSPGGVHSHMSHGVAMAELARRAGIDRVYFHVFTDGRDEAPRSAVVNVADFIAELARIGTGTIATLAGRYYAMDRDSRWDRIDRAYAVITGGGPLTSLDPVAYINAEYARDVSDEFIEPVRFDPDVRIRDGDGIVFWNFRPDRARQLTHALVDEEFNNFDRGPGVGNLDFVTFTEYDRDLNVRVAFPRLDVTETLAEVVSRAGLRQFHVAETEKYAHVTYFINGGREKTFTGEERLLVPSPQVATYEAVPEMSAGPVTDAVVAHINAATDALIIVNFANPDMIGHTGVFAATVDAVEYVDACLGRIVDATLAAGGACLITADHGNAEQKINPIDNSPLTAHTTNPVPVLLCGAEVADLRGGGGLRDIAPTALEVLGLAVPPAMTGRSLVS